MRKVAMLALFAIAFGMGLAGVGQVTVANAFPNSPIEEYPESPI